MKQKVIATYESTPYTSRAFKASSPLRLEAISALFGFKSKELGSCRVLELGCSFGANIIYAALNAPAKAQGLKSRPSSQQGWFLAPK